MREDIRVPLGILCQLLAAHGLLTPAIVRFAESNPDIRIASNVQPRHELSGRIQQAKFDVGVYVVPFLAKEVEIIEVLEMLLQVLLPKGHHLTNRHFLTPKDMGGEKYVAVKRGLMVREAIERMLARSGDTLEIFQELSGTATAHPLVAGGGGYLQRSYGFRSRLSVLHRACALETGSEDQFGFVQPTKTYTA